MGNLLTMKQVAERLQLDSRALERLIRKSHIHYVKIGDKTRRIDEDVLNQYIKDKTYQTL